MVYRCCERVASRDFKLDEKFWFFAVLSGMIPRRQPEGRPTIARRFIAGTEHRRRPSPVRDDRSSGRETPPATAFFRPSGTQSGTAAQPSDESLGYFQWSLTGHRDILRVSRPSPDSTLNSLNDSGNGPTGRLGRKPSPYHARRLHTRSELSMPGSRRDSTQRFSGWRGARTFLSAAVRELGAKRTRMSALRAKLGAAGFYPRAAGL
jgi:hypothetical protein